MIKRKKKRVFYNKLVDFIQCRTYFRPFMHAIVAWMIVLFSKMVKKIKMFLCIFAIFLFFLFPFFCFSFFYPISALFQSFLKRSSFSLDALEQQCYNYLHVLYNLVIYIYMYKQVYVYKDRILIKFPQFRVMDIS